MYKKLKNKIVITLLTAVLGITAYGVHKHEQKQEQLRNAISVVNVIMHTSKTIDQIDERLTKQNIEHSIDGKNIHIYKDGSKYTFKVIGMEA